LRGVDTTGLKLQWGNREVVLELIELIAKRKGLGDILAEGSKRASEIIGRNSSSFAIHGKNLELPGHDPRCFNGLALGYATANRGACHNDSFSFVYEIMRSDASLKIMKPLDRLASEGKGSLVFVLQNLMALCDSLKICKFVVLVIEAADLHRWLNWITGWGIDFEEFLRIGERIFNLKRLYNNRCGIDRKDDNLPRRILTLKREGLRAPERLPDINKMLDEYYIVRGWDEKGIPSKRKLSQLGLEGMI
jgi:aldehyde:ferredoxin oxidoreductase